MRFGLGFDMGFNALQEISASSASSRKFDTIPTKVNYFDEYRSHRIKNYYFLILPKLTMLAFSSAVEPLRLANITAGRQIYRWKVLSQDGKAVVCSNGININVDGGLEMIKHPSSLIICSGLDGYQAATSHTLNAIRVHYRKGGRIGGICTGAYSLARAGLLKNKKFTLHWDNKPAFAEYFPELEISQQIYENDAGIFTCGGGIAVTDMMLTIIDRDHGVDVANKVSDLCLRGTRRQQSFAQKSPISASINSRNVRLINIVQYMQDNIEEPLSFDELAELGHISKRQIERLFKRYMGVSPSRYYKSMRLDVGRSLLSETNMPVTEIAMACGFGSASSFSKSFKERFDQNPVNFVPT